MDKAPTFKVGLRFRKGDEITLRAVAHRIRSGDYATRAAIGKGVSLYDNAARAAATGEPLIVQCSDPVEAVALADGFTALGLQRPAVEALPN